MIWHKVKSIPYFLKVSIIPLSFYKKKKKNFVSMIMAFYRSAILFRFLLVSEKQVIRQLFCKSEMNLDFQKVGSTCINISIL